MIVLSCARIFLFFTDLVARFCLFRAEVRWPLPYVACGFCGVWSFFGVDCCSGGRGLGVCVCVVGKACEFWRGLS